MIERHPRYGGRSSDFRTILPEVTVLFQLAPGMALTAPNVRYWSNETVGNGPRAVAAEWRAQA